MDLLELAERCEQAEGPDRELDALIHCAHDPGYRIVRWATIAFVSGNGGHATNPINYSGSLDAAMTLVPEGWNGNLGFIPTRPRYWVELARPEHDPLLVGKYSGRSNHSAALALCAAAFRARGRAAITSPASDEIRAQSAEIEAQAKARFDAAGKALFGTGFTARHPRPYG